MKRSLSTIIPFLTIIGVFSVGTLLQPDKDKSEIENRKLAKLPSVANIYDKTYTSKFEDYFSDHFLLRDQFLHTSVIKDLYLNKTSIKDRYVIDNEYILMKAAEQVSEEDLEKTTNNVISFSQQVKDLGKQFTYIMIPRKTTVQQFLFPSYLEKLEEDLEQPYRFLDNLEEQGIYTVNLVKYFLEHFSEDERLQLYYLTDHHWNTRGAYEAFKYIINTYDDEGKGLGYKILDEDYTQDIVEDIKFTGSYNKSLFMEVPYETEVPYVHRKENSNKQYFMLKDGKLQKVDERTIVARKVKKGEFVTYAETHTSDLAYYKVINENYKIDKKLLIFKDSYQNAMTWMLSDLFKEVEVIDLRHTGDKAAIDFVKESDADMVWIMYNNRNLNGDIFKTIY